MKKIILACFFVAASFQVSASPSQSESGLTPGGYVASVGRFCERVRNKVIYKNPDYIECKRDPFSSVSRCKKIYNEFVWSFDNGVMINAFVQCGIFNIKRFKSHSQSR